MAERILVYGLGAIGAQVAGRLHSAGCDIVGVEPWAAQRAALAGGGVRIRTLEGDEERHRPAVLAPGELKSEVDICLLAVKSYDTERALAQVLPHLARGACVVSLQNSINEEAIVPVIGAARVLGGVVLVNAVLLEPGLVTATASVSRAAAGARLPGVRVGQFGVRAGEPARRIAGLLAQVWPAVTIDDLLGERWSKMVTNTALNPISGISGLRSAAMLANAAARRAIACLAAETLAVAAAEGHPQATVMGDASAAEVREAAAQRGSAFDARLASRAARVSADAATSLLQDVLRGRRTEVDHFSGLVARKGRQHAIATPVCDAATAMVHEVEAGRRAPAPSNIVELLRCAG